MSRETACDVEVQHLTDSESAAAFHAPAMREMGISGVEFLRRWDAGEWNGVDPDDVPGLVDVSMALVLVR